MAHLAGKKILIVDDEPNLRLLYEAEFSSEGYQVVLAGDGREAIDVVKKEKPNLVILDIAMPGMDGISAMGEILGCDNGIPVILNSAYTHYKDDFQSWSADAYVVKSSNLQELKETVVDLLEI